MKISLDHACDSRQGLRRCLGRPKACDSGPRLEHLLDIAAGVFKERGYESASVGEIARRAGASKQTLYVRFPSKASLFKAVMRRDTERLQEQFKHILIPDKPPGEVLESLGMELIEKMLDGENFRLHRTLVTAAESFPELAVTFWDYGPRRVKETLTEYIHGQVRMGVLKTSDPERAASLFLSACAGEYLPASQLRIQLVPSPEAARPHVKEAVRMFLAAYT